jgi:hypothetical protein
MSTEHGASQPSAEPVPYVSVLEELRALRAEARCGLPFRFLLGTSRFEEMVAYMDGYLRCAWRNGVDDLAYGAFRDWLSDIKGEFSEGWKQHYVAVCGGDHERAMMRLLDFVAEFLSLPQQSSVALPPGAQELPPALFPASEHYVSVLDELLYIRSRVQSGFPLWLAIGTETLPTLLTLIHGYLRCAERHGLSDSRWLAFSHWLSEARNLPSDSLAPALLRRSGGDHIEAMKHLLELVAASVQEHPGLNRARGWEGAAGSKSSSTD